MLICLNIALKFTLYRIVKYFDHLKKKTRRAKWQVSYTA